MSSTMPAAPATPPAANGSVDPNKTFGIIALVVSIFFSIIGAILGIVAYTKSKKAGFTNKFALAAIIVGFVLFVIQLILVILAITAGVAAVELLQEACAGVASGTVVETTDGLQVTCP